LFYPHKETSDWKIFEEAANLHMHETTGWLKRENKYIIPQGSLSFQDFFTISLSFALLFRESEALKISEPGRQKAFCDRLLLLCSLHNSIEFQLSTSAHAASLYIV